MHMVGRRSWRLSVGDDELLTAALIVRDAVGLVVEADDVPPPLADAPPSSAVLDGEDLTAVAGDWLGWWRALVAAGVEGRRDEPPRGRKAFEVWARRSAVRHESAGAPPDFAGLGHAPGLRRAAVALFRDAAAHQDRASLHGTLHERPWADTRRAVDEVAARRGVDPGVLDGTVIVVPTSGPWWRVAQPGFALASPHADALDAAVSAALETSLDRHPSV